MDVWDIAVYLFLGLLGMGLTSLSIVIISYGYMKDEERMKRKLIEGGVGLDLEAMK